MCCQTRARACVCVCVCENCKHDERIGEKPDQEFHIIICFPDPEAEEDDYDATVECFSTLLFCSGGDRVAIGI